jgi:hypothetical protein
VRSGILLLEVKMRLYEVRYLIEKHLPNLSKCPTKAAGNEQVIIDNFREPISSMEALLPTGVFDNELEMLHELGIFMRTEIEHFIVPSSQANLLNNMIIQTKRKAELIALAINSLYFEIDENTIAIKLPENIDLKDLADTIKEIDRFLHEAVVNKYTNGTVTFLGFDRGSAWIIVCVGIELAMRVIARILNFSQDYRAKEIQIQGDREVVRRIKMDNDLKENAIAALDNELEEYREELYLEILRTGNVPEDSGEPTVRLKSALERWEKLSSRAVEIHPSLDSKSIELFSGLEALPSEPKKLESGELEEEDQED